MAFTDKFTTPEAMKFIDQVGDAYKNVPFHLPKGAVNFFVAVSPWLALIGGVLGLLLGPFGAIGSLLSILTLSPTVIIDMVLATTVMILSSVIALMAFKPLKERKLLGWVLMFWNQMFSVVSVLLNVFFNGGNGVIGGVIGMLVGMYILFEMKPRYQ